MRAERPPLDRAADPPDKHVTVKIENGWLTLEGNVDYGYQKKSAEKSVQNLTGVRGITNLVRVKPPASPFDVKKEMPPVDIAIEATGVDVRVSQLDLRRPEGADVFLGLATGNLVTGEMVKRMGPKPIIMALANPDPEIAPQEAAPLCRILATGYDVKLPVDATLTGEHRLLYRLNRENAPLVSALALLFGIVCFVVYTRMPWKPFFRLIVILPMLSPPFVVAASYVLLFGPRGLAGVLPPGTLARALCDERRWQRPRARRGP